MILGTSSKEEWLRAPVPNESESAARLLIPAVSIRYWKENDEGPNGRGKTRTLRYCKNGPSFSDHWEILYDW